MNETLRHSGRTISDYVHGRPRLPQRGFDLLEVGAFVWNGKIEHKANELHALRTFPGSTVIRAAGSAASTTHRSVGHSSGRVVRTVSRWPLSHRR
jgi:hypothetical protein